MLGLFVTNYCGSVSPLFRSNYGYYAKQSQFNRTGTRQSDFNLSLGPQILRSSLHNGNVPNTHNHIPASVRASTADNSTQQKPLSTRKVARESIKRQHFIFMFKKTLTSIPACRKTLCAGKNNRYFDFKHLKIHTYLNTSYNVL